MAPNVGVAPVLSMTPPPFTPRPAPEAPVLFGPLLLVPGKKEGRYPYCHSLVITGPETWVVDPSARREFFQHLARRRRVTRVFFSHFHEDHFKYHRLFPDAVCYGPAAELAAFRSLDAVYALMGVTLPAFREHLAQTLPREFHFPVAAPLLPFHPGERFVNGDVVLEVVPAPGHTPGHSFFAFPHQDLIYLADVDLTPFGPWYADETSDLDAFMNTLARVREFPATTFLTAHEQGIFSAEELPAALAAYRQVLIQREERLLELLDTPQTLARLAARRLIYGRAREPQFVYDHMERQMLGKHLARLAAHGWVEETAEGYLRRR